jgi:hypothetical protein
LAYSKKPIRIIEGKNLPEEKGKHFGNHYSDHFNELLEIIE